MTLFEIIMLVMAGINLLMAVVVMFIFINFRKESQRRERLVKRLERAHYISNSEVVDMTKEDE